MKIRIVSSGHGRETHIFGVSDDGTLTPIHGVQAVLWEVPGPRERALAKLTVFADVNVVGDVEEWRPVRRDPTIAENGARPFELADHVGIAIIIAAFVAVLLIEIL